MYFLTSFQASLICKVVAEPVFRFQRPRFTNNLFLVAKHFCYIIVLVSFFRNKTSDSLKLRLLRFFHFSLYWETMLENAISCEWLFNWFCPTYVWDWIHYIHHQEYIDRRVKRVSVWLLFFRCAFGNLIDRCLIIWFHFLGIFHFPWNFSFFFHLNWYLIFG